MGVLSEYLSISPIANSRSTRFFEHPRLIAENVIKEENIVVLVVMVKVKRDAIIVLERAKIAMVKNVENVLDEVMKSVRNVETV